jgi:extracellular factor (EF) 3-hydroxypalmitic acid methyl ester biosynthesis protein
MSAVPEPENDSLILCENSQGTSMRGSLLRLTRYVATFEVYNPYSILQLSEILANFKIIISGKTAYSGRATVSSLVNTGLVLVCEASLDDESWLEVDVLSPGVQLERLASDFDRVVVEWRKVVEVNDDLKTLVSDIQTFLSDLRRWLEQIELAVRSSPLSERSAMELGVIERLNTLVLPVIAEQFKKFEVVTAGVGPDVEAVHRAYCRRQIHPLVLCAPFVHRTYQKPLGYAGDYEMVNMILRDPREGASLFAKVVNMFFVAAPPAEAHRNRITYLSGMLAREARRSSREGQILKVFNLGCGPAKEVQDLLMYEDLCERTDFTLLDFNDETLERTSRLLNELKMKHRRSTPIRTVKKSVHQVLKEGARVNPSDKNEVYDVVYCAGLFDYLSDRVCRRLLEIFYEMVAPGGLLVATNVDASNPVRHMMEYVMEWHLIYRDADGFLKLAPEVCDPDRVRVSKDDTGVNLFLEIRKPPSHA